MTFGYPKMTAAQVRDAVARYAAGERLQSIADTYQVTPSAITYHAAKHVVLRRDQGPAAIRHGTRAGYQAHRRHGTRACDDCRQANTEASRLYTQARP